MSKRYSPDHRTLVLKLLRYAFKNDIAATSRFCMIPERTIREWRRQAELAKRSRPVANATTHIARRQPRG
jgi:hypothetical protein